MGRLAPVEALAPGVAVARRGPHIDRAIADEVEAYVEGAGTVNRLRHSLPASSARFRSTSALILSGVRNLSRTLNRALRCPSGTK